VATIFAILRLLIPIAIVFFAWRYLMPRIRGSQQQQSGRIDVDVRVVNSEQHKVDLEEYENSEVFVKKQPYEQESESSQAPDTKQ